MRGELTTASSVTPNGAPVTSNNLNNVGTVNVNSVQVSDTSQAGLQSLVNVNAAGSSVDVALNIVVVIDSQVQNINNSNVLNNLSSLQVR
ncbi:MAG: hypothetical protein KC900_08025 [Candidatus Omnitrophica bacterium]|nr:hypothetical protein [Candidatus Omnitrophota bacterium]